MKNFIIIFYIIVISKAILSQNTGFQDEKREGERDGGRRGNNRRQENNDNSMRNEEPAANILPENSQTLGYNTTGEQVVEEKSPVSPSLQEPSSGSSQIPPDALASDVCVLPMEIGPCRAAIPRYYYNPNQGDCESFLYGGCEGNYNNFESYEKCIQFCMDSIDISSPQITMSPDPELRDKISEIHPISTSTNMDTTTDNESSSGNNHHNHRWPLFGGILAGFYSLMRHLFFW